MAFRTDRNLRYLFAALFLWTFGVGLYDQLIPIYARQLGASPVELGSLFTLRNLALAGGFLIGWLLADRYSHAALMVASWVSALPVPLLLAAAPTYLWLLPGLLLYELTFFGLPAVQAYITQRVDRTEIASTFGAMGTITSLGFLTAPTVGGMIADRWSIRATLAVAFVVYVLSTMLILRVRRDRAGAAGPGERPAISWDRLRPLVPALWVYVGMSLVVLITLPFVTPFLREVRGLSLARIGFLGSTVALGAVLLASVAGRVGDRVGLAPSMAGALVVFALGITLTIYGPVALLPVFSPLRARAPLHTLGHAMIGARADPAMVGRAFSLAGMASAVVAAAGVLGGGYAYRVEPALPLLISVGLAVLLAMALLVWRPGNAPEVPQGQGGPVDTSGTAGAPGRP